MEFLERGRAALAFPDFRRYQVGRLCAIVGIQMQMVAVGWQVYALTGRAFDLGLVGLVQFVPFTLLVTAGGHAADRYDRRRVLMAGYFIQGLCSLALAALAIGNVQRVWPIYLVLAVLGAGRAFASPAASALTPHLVPVEHFSNAIAWGSSARQIAMLVGPALGGLLYTATNASPVYLLAGLASFLGAWLVLRMEVRLGRMEPKDLSWSTVLAGFAYVWEKRLLLGTFSLDLFAVLLGGATALLPVYAKDILHVGPWGLGMLRSAPAVGAGLAALWLAHRPLQRNAGKVMLGFVFLFGLATVIFGVSRSLPLSLVALAVLGGSDMVSVVIRLTLEQLGTPPQMRGRVSAVNMMFIGASNELGEFESGATAALWGPVPAVVLGGVGTCLVVGLWALLFPELREVDSVQSP